MNSIDDIINTLTRNPSLVDDLSNEEVDFLIRYLQEEITEKEEVLMDMEATN
jgi:hypothetical protein